MQWSDKDHQSIWCWSELLLVLSYFDMLYTDMFCWFHISFWYNSIIAFMMLYILVGTILAIDMIIPSDETLEMQPTTFNFKFVMLHRFEFVAQVSWRWRIGRTVRRTSGRKEPPLRKGWRTTAKLQMTRWFFVVNSLVKIANRLMTISDISVEKEQVLMKFVHGKDVQTSRALSGESAATAKRATWFQDVSRP